MYGELDNAFADLHDELLKAEADITADDVVLYSLALLKGVAAGLNDVISMLLHPIDEVLCPLIEVLYDANIINMAHLDGVLTYKKNFEGNSIYNVSTSFGEVHIEPTNPRTDSFDGNAVYHFKASDIADALKRMDLRVMAIKKLGQQFIDADKATKVEMLSQLTTSYLVPGKLLTANLKLVNLHRFGTFEKPPKGVNMENNCPNPAPIKKLSLRDIRSISGEKCLIYVITEKSELIVYLLHSPTLSMHYGKPITKIYHPELSKLIPAYAIGILHVVNGYITFINYANYIALTNNVSGDFAPNGLDFEKLVENAFLKVGFSEAQGKFRFWDNSSGINMILPSAKEVNFYLEQSALAFNKAVNSNNNTLDEELKAGLNRLSPNKPNNPVFIENNSQNKVTSEVNHSYFSGESSNHYFPGFFPFTQSSPPSSQSNNNSYGSSDSGGGSGSSGRKGDGGSQPEYQGSSKCIGVSFDGGKTFSTSCFPC